MKRKFHEKPNDILILRRRWCDVENAPLAVSGEVGKYPEFKGNVKGIDARPFWRDKSVSPSGAGYHYNHNAETYMEVGQALGWAMAELLKKI